VSGVLSGINVVEGTLSNGECPLGHVLIKFQKYKLTRSGDIYLKVCWLKFQVARLAWICGGVGAFPGGRRSQSHSPTGPNYHQWTLRCYFAPIIGSVRDKLLRNRELVKGEACHGGVPQPPWAPISGALRKAWRPFSFKYISTLRP